MDSPIVLSSGESDDDDDVILIEDTPVRTVEDTDDDDIVFICVEESDVKKNKPLDLTSATNKNLSPADQSRGQTANISHSVLDLTQEPVTEQTAKQNDNKGCVGLLNNQTTSNTDSQSDDSDTDDTCNTPSVSNKRKLDKNDRQTEIRKKYWNTPVTGYTEQSDNSQNIPSTSCDKFAPDRNGNPSYLNSLLPFAAPSHQPSLSNSRYTSDSPYNLSDLLSLTSDVLDTHAQTPISQDFNIPQNNVSNYNCNIGFSSAIDYKNVPPRKRLKTEHIDGMFNNSRNGNCVSFTQFLSSTNEPSVSDLEDRLSERHVCCVCEIVGKVSNMSSCTDGHHTCSSCLEVSVKYILCQRDKQASLKCPYLGCDSFFLTSQLKRTMPPMIVEILEKHMEQNCYTIVEEESVESSGEFPNVWVEMDPKAPFTMVTLQPGSDDYVQVAHEFHKTLPFGLYDIDQIYRVQNPILWKFFSVKKEQMTSDNGTALEKFLFHGTSPNSIDAICRSGFDWRLSGLNGTVHGKGSYFAEAAKYSHQYSAKGVFAVSSPSLLPSANWRTSMLKTLTVQMSQMRQIIQQQNGGIIQNTAHMSHLQPTPIQPKPIQPTPAQPTTSTYLSPLNLSTVAHSGTGPPPNISLQATMPQTYQFGKRSQHCCTGKPRPSCLSALRLPPAGVALITPPVPTPPSTNLPVFKMFMARVLVGNMTTGSCNLLKPPPIDPTNDPLGKCFDTCVDNVFSPKIYVVFDIAQAYPEYVIHYKQIAPFS